MNATQLAEKFSAKILAAGKEKSRQKVIADDNNDKRLNDVDHCHRAMKTDVIPLLEELKHEFPNGEFSFAPQVDGNNHSKVVGVSFTIGDGPPTSISTAFGNVIVTHAGASGASKGAHFVYSPDAEPYISNSGDLTREKIAKLVSMTIDNV